LLVVLGKYIGGARSYEHYICKDISLLTPNQ